LELRVSLRTTIGVSGEWSLESARSIDELADIVAGVVVDACGRVDDCRLFLRANPPVIRLRCFGDEAEVVMRGDDVAVYLFAAALSIRLTSVS